MSGQHVSGKIERLCVQNKLGRHAELIDSRDVGVDEKSCFRSRTTVRTHGIYCRLEWQGSRSQFVMTFVYCKGRGTTWERTRWRPRPRLDPTCYFELLQIRAPAFGWP